VKLGKFSREQIWSIVVNFKNVPKNLVFVKLKLDNGRLHRKGSFHLNNFSLYINIVLFPDHGQIRAGFSGGLPGLERSRKKSCHKGKIFS